MEMERWSVSFVVPPSLFVLLLNRHQEAAPSNLLASARNASLGVFLFETLSLSKMKILPGDDSLYVQKGDVATIFVVGGGGGGGGRGSGGDDDDDLLFPLLYFLQIVNVVCRLQWSRIGTRKRHCCCSESCNRILFFWFYSTEEERKKLPPLLSGVALLDGVEVLDFCLCVLKTVWMSDVHFEEWVEDDGA